MMIGEILKQKRVEIGYTQEQIAQYLGVSTPAVNKWEKAVSYPDITLLSPLARLLKIDLNTLLSFEEELTDREIGNFANEVSDIIQKEGFCLGYEITMEKIRQYPSNWTLLQTMAVILDGALAMSPLEKEEGEGWQEKINSLYMRCADCGDKNVADRAKFMLASKFIKSKNYEKAQEMIDLLPPKPPVDKKQLQISALIGQNNLNEASKLLEGELLAQVNNSQSILINMIDIALKEGRVQAAYEIAHIAQKSAHIFGLWEYNGVLPLLQVAVGEQNVKASLEYSEKLLKALISPYQMNKSPLYSHIPTKEGADFSAPFLSGILSELKTSPQWEFLRGEEGFQNLILEYEKKIVH
ncbi:MAG: helix-turn-helix transcriptional regulator [Oscillospiraceae bacterium]